MPHRVSMLALALVVALAGAAVASPQSESTALDLYSRMHAALAGDSAEGVVASAGELAGRMRAAARDAQNAAAYEELAAVAGKMQGDDLAALREQFKAVSVAFAAYVNAAGTAGAQLYYCPMADGYWAQKTDDAGVKNPYYGKSMLKCGSKVERVES